MELSYHSGIGLFHFRFTLVGVFVVSPTPWILLSYHASVQNRLVVKDSCLMFLLFLLRTNLHDKLLILLQDYEYASFNPVAYDIANHFCEMAADYHSPEPHILDYSKYPGIAFFLRVNFTKPQLFLLFTKLQLLMMVSENYNYYYHLFQKTTNFVVGPPVSLTYEKVSHVRLTGGTMHKSCSFLKKKVQNCCSFLKPNQKL
jgi:hypothetical protein